MSTAAVMMSPATSTLVESRIFRGDADGLVDRLIAACEQKPASSAHYSGYGRELVPWCDFETPSSAIVSQPLEKLYRAALPALANANSKFPAGSHKHDRAGKATSSPQHRNGGNASPEAKRSKRSKAADPGQVKGVRQITSKAIGIAHTGGLSDNFSCPAFTSPKPEVIPMPTSSLFCRAVAKNLSSGKVAVA